MVIESKKVYFTKGSEKKSYTIYIEQKLAEHYLIQQRNIHEN